MEMITSFKRKETRFLSNFYPVTVTLDGEQYAGKIFYESQRKLFPFVHFRPRLHEIFGHTSPSNY